MKSLIMNDSPGSNIILRDIGFSLLSEGKTLKVRADGWSMYPTLKPGCIILIEPPESGSLPVPGEIIAWKREAGLVVHRVVRILKNKDIISIITRGDSCASEDIPVIPERIAGKVVQVEDPSGKVLASGDDLVRKPLYLYNRFIVGLLIRIKRIRNIFLK